MSDLRTITGSFPWFTLSMIATAYLLMAWPAASEYALYERSAIIDGQWWRVFTGNFAHFNGSHLMWNSVVLLVVGIWLEHQSSNLARWFMLLSPVAIGLALLIFEPQLEIYAGLSGVVTGVAMLLSLQLLWKSPGDRLWGVALLLLVLLKLAIEWVSEESLFAHFSDKTIRVVLLSHVVGLIFAVLFFWITFRARNRSVEAPSENLSGADNLQE